MTTAAVTVTPHDRFRMLAARFFGYLSADGLNYALGFLIYGWLVRVLTNQQYGQLSIATSVYQALMMVAALGLDLTGPKLLKDFGGDALEFARKALHLRLAVALLICGPLQIAAALFAWHRGQNLLALIVLASFSMVVARALDLTYLAVALRVPGPLAKTRALGLSAYLLLLVLCTPIIRQHLWLIPVLNAVGVTLGRVRLARLLRRYVPPSGVAHALRSWDIVTQGIKASGGQLLLLILQTGDVVLLAKYVSTDAVGQYAMISRLYLLGLAVLGAMFNTFLPDVVHVAHDVAKLRAVFRTCVFANLALGVAGAIVFYWISTPLSQLSGASLASGSPRHQPNLCPGFLVDGHSQSVSGDAAQPASRHRISTGNSLGRGSVAGLRSGAYAALWRGRRGLRTSAGNGLSCGAQHCRLFTARARAARRNTHG